MTEPGVVVSVTNGAGVCGDRDYGVEYATTEPGVLVSVTNGAGVCGDRDYGVESATTEPESFFGSPRSAFSIE
ncbi:unnamed protein product [Lampetra planeri]